MRTLSQHPWLMNPQFLLVLLELLPSTKKGPFLFNLWGLWLGIYFKLRCSVQFSCSVTFNSLQSHGPQHTRLFCPSLTPRASSNSCPSSQWCPPTILSSLVPFSCLQSFPVSGSFPMSQFFASDGKSFGASASASVLPMNIQDWFPLGLFSYSPLCPTLSDPMNCSTPGLPVHHQLPEFTQTHVHRVGDAI